jgi:4-amino-4-deoxy-L-arabinose transferase-like glycosyltransferase
MSIDVPAPPTLTAYEQLPATRVLKPPAVFDAPPAPKRGDRLLTAALSSSAIWLVPLLIVQAWFSFRLTNTLEQDEALYINAGHQLIAHMLHGTRTPAFGSYFSGVPALYSVPAAMLDHVGGPALVHAANTLLVMAATIFVYLSTRRLFGHGPALIAAGIFAVNPAAIFVGRFASFDAPSLFLLAVSTYLAIRASERWQFALALGPCLILATAEKYFALAFIPSVLALLVLVSVQRVGRRRAARTVAISAAGLLVAGGVAALLIAPLDWHGLLSTSINRAPILPESRADLLRACAHYIGALTVAGLIGAVLLWRRWLIAAVLFASALIPALVQIKLNESASLHKNLAFGVLFLAPLVGVAGVALLRQGRLLILRAPAALACVALVLSSGMGTSSAMVHGWPNAAGIDKVLAQYVQRGSDQYLVDNSSVQEYYLSGISNYSQWETTFAPIYQGPNGAQIMQNQLTNGKFSLFLYCDEGSTLGLDHQMLTVLERRYTLVAKVPLSAADTHQFWYLWRAELPQ